MSVRRLRRLLWPLLGAAVLVAFLVVAVLPTGTYLEQRQSIAAEEAQVRVLDEENAKLAARVAELHTDTEVERLARRQYNLVRPGEEAYAILPAAGEGPSTGVLGSGATTPPPPPQPWWGRAVDTLSFWD